MSLPAPTSYVSSESSHARVEQTNADPRRIKIEVTESRLIAEMDSSVRPFHRLRELGISVSIDEQRLMLVERSCDLIQGWLVAPAMPLDAFSEWMVRVLPEIQHRFAGGTTVSVAPV